MRKTRVRLELNYISLNVMGTSGHWPSISIGLIDRLVSCFDVISGVHETG